MPAAFDFAAAAAAECVLAFAVAAVVVVAAVAVALLETSAFVETVLSSSPPTLLSLVQTAFQLCPLSKRGFLSPTLSSWG